MKKNPFKKLRTAASATANYQENGAHRGAAHNTYNLNYKQPKSIPVLFHNCKNYDTHLLMSRLGRLQNYKIEIVPNTMEKCITFKLVKEDCPISLIFMDSLQFLPSSLGSNPG